MPQDRLDVSYPGGLTRLFVQAPLVAGASVEPDEGQSHLLVNVLRARVGDHVRVFNGTDGEWRTRISAVSKRAVTLDVTMQVRAQRAVPDLWLLVAPVKKSPFDFTVQKATELGIARIQPVMTRRTIVDRVNLQRMRANVIEAAEQSERLCVPEVCEPVSLERLLGVWPSHRRLMFCDEGGDAKPAAVALSGSELGPWAILTGPEGGFEPVERELLRGQSFVTPVTLGPRIMRADTAALAAIAVWQSTLGDWG
jgi:16S rRNA (uracil1498-N3)-methyltransferase